MLDVVCKEHGHLSRWEIVDLVHTLPEWHDPEGEATPIGYADILQAFNKKPEEIASTVDELSSLARIDALCV